MKTKHFGPFPICLDNVSPFYYYKSKQFGKTMDSSTSLAILIACVVVANILTSWIKSPKSTWWEDDERRRKG